MRLSSYIWFFLLAVCGPPAQAVAQVNDEFCRNGLFTVQNRNFGLSAISGSGRAYLIDSLEGCRSRDTFCEMMNRRYVIPGDKVITGEQRAGMVCVYFINSRGGDAGWVQTSRLRPISFDITPSRHVWLGRWSDGGNPAIEITSRRNRLDISGVSYWPGPDRQRDWPSGWPHSGSIDGNLNVSRNRAHYWDGSCRVDFILLNDIIVAFDNDRCGGMNVHFSGIYVKRI